jgi:ATP:ADP antiporter, AAA family
VKEHLAGRAAAVTALALIAQQVGSNALRDGLLLSAFPVTSLPWFIAGSAVLAFPIAGASGRFLQRFGPRRLAPILMACSAAMFFVEWAMLSWPRAAAVVVYGHSSILGAIAISAFYSLLNESFDPHSAKPLMARVAGAAALGGLLGGVGAERIATVFDKATLLLTLGTLGLITVSGALLSKFAGRTSQPVKGEIAPDSEHFVWQGLQATPLLRSLAWITALSAMVASLFDYMLKVEAVAWFGKGEPLVRFFGIFYAVTGLSSFLMQAVLGRVVMAKLGLSGSVALHPAIVGAAGLLRVVIPAPWGSIFPRSLDMTLRNSVFRAGYELFYTPLPQASKRAAKSLIDVTADSIGKGTASLVLLLLTRLLPGQLLLAVNVTGLLAAIAELGVALRLRNDYLRELARSLRRQGDALVPVAEQSLSDFTLVRSFAGLDRTALRKALGQPESNEAAISDPVVAAFSDLRSGDPHRAKRALESLPQDPALIGAVVPLLANRRLLRTAAKALSGFGSRGVGEMVSTLLDEQTPEAVRRRIPLVLKSCDSRFARDGLAAALQVDAYQIRLRAGHALLSMAEEHPALALSREAGLAAVEAELQRGTSPHAARQHIFNLLALALDRESIRMATQGLASSDRHVRGTALEYLETAVPSALWRQLRPVFEEPIAPATTAPALETFTISLAAVRRKLESTQEEAKPE